MRSPATFPIRKRKCRYGNELVRQEIVGASPAERSELMARNDSRIDALGSGSDYSPFLQHLGIASMNIGFGGEDGGGSYHSIYDSFDHYTRFGDPDFSYGIALAKVCGHAVLRLSDADTLPFDFANFTETVGRYVDEVIKLTDSMRDETRSTNRIIENGMWKAVEDPTETFVLPKIKDEVPYLNFAPLQNALAKLKQSTSDYKTASAGKLSAKDQKALDEILFTSERVLTRKEGLPRRDWYRHQIYAPGFYTGYGVKTLPGIREAIEQRDWKEANEQIVIVSKTIENFAANIDRAAKMF